MNVELLRKVGRMIVANPSDFDMSYWHQIKGDRSMSAIPTQLPDREASNCGTTHCIAGWTQLLAGDMRKDALVEARRLLGLTGPQCGRLFNAHQWPDGFCDNEPTAAQAQARIEHFIATEGRE